MDARLLVTLMGLGLVGFLFYPRADPPPTPGVTEYVTTSRAVEGESVRLAGVQRPDPPVHTYDLGFVYRVDRMELLFANASENGPKLYELLASQERAGTYRRIFTFHGSSRAYPYTVQRFPDSHEARWVQLVVGDWFSGKPGVESLRVGPVYRREWNPIQSVSTSHNARDAGLLIDGLRDDRSRWAGAQVEETVKEEDGQETTERAFSAPGGDVTIVADLGATRSVYGSRITPDGGGGGPRRYALALSQDGISFTEAFVGDLPDDGLSYPAMLPAPTEARYARWTIVEGDWYGEYPALRELEVFTDEYRLPPSTGEAMQDYTPILVREDNCGVDNRRAPNLTQGFAFDRGEGDDSARYMWRSSADIEGEATERQRSFAYHYDTLRLSYTGLRPDRLYWLQTLYQQDSATARRQNLVVDGYLMHGDDASVPSSASEPYTYSVPAEALADGALNIAINRLAGPNAVLSAAWLYEARPGSEGASEADDAPAAKVTEAVEPKVIDGSLEEWDRLYPLTPAEGDATRAYVEWDAENLYVAVVTQTRHMPAGATVGDTVDLFIDSTNARSPALYREGDVHLRVYRYGSGREEARYITHYSDEAAGVTNPPTGEMASSTSEGEYILEARLPRQGMLDAWSPGEGGRFGVNFIVSLRPDRLWWLATERRDDPPIRWREARMIGSVRADAWLGPTRTPDALVYAGSDLLVVVRDPDANVDPEAVDEVTARLEGGTLGDTLDVTLREVRGSQLAGRLPEEAITADGEYFAGLAPTRHIDRMDPRHGIALTGGESVTLTYVDRFAHPTGAAETISASATVATGANGVLTLAGPGVTPLVTFRAGEDIAVVVTDGDLAAAAQPAETETEPEAATEGDPGDPEPATESEPGDQEDETSGADPPDDPATEAPSTTVVARVARPDDGNIGDAETLVLTLTADASFAGSIPTAYAESAQPEDGVLQLRGMDRVEVTYVDRVQEDGATNVELTAAARAAIGATASLAMRGAGAAPALVGAGPTPVTAGSPVIVLVEDGDMNQDRSVADAVEVLLTAEARGDSVSVTLRESDIDTGVFRAMVPTAYAAAIDLDNDILELTGSELVTAAYVDQLQGSGRTDVRVTAEAITLTGGDATLAIVRGDYVQVAPRLNAGATVYMRLVEPDAETSDLTVQVTSLATGDAETVLLAASAAGASQYIGSIPTTFAATGSADDGVLSVLGDDTVRATYVDELGASGAPDTSVTSDARINIGSDGSLLLPPGAQIPIRAGSLLHVEVRDPDLNARSAVLEQTTVTARVEPGGDTLDILVRETGGDTGVFVGTAPTTYGALSVNDDTLQITGQSAITVDYLDAIRADGETGAPLTATRYVETGVSGSLALLSLDGRRPLTRMTPGDMALARVTDSDLNADPNFDESTQITVSGSLVGDSVLLPLRETGVDTGVFEVRIATEHVRDGAEHDRFDLLLQVVDREQVTATYVDELSDAGEPMRSVQRSAVASVTNAATVLLEDAYGVEIGEFLAGSPLYVSLDEPLLAADADAVGPSVVLESLSTGDTVAVATTPLPGGQGRYWTRVATRYAVTPVADDVLEVQGGEEVRVRYRSPGRDVDAFDSAAVASGSRGVLTVTYADGRPLSTFTPGDGLHVRLEDPDRDLSPLDADESLARVTAQGGERRDVQLVETGPATGVFRGVAPTVKTMDVGPENSDALPLRGGEAVVVSYRDPLVATGETGIEVTASSRARRIGAAPYTAEQIVIDGIPDRWPLEDAMAPAEGGILVWAQWGRDALYVFAQVSDDDIAVTDVTRWHEGSDALELHFDLDMDRQGNPAHLDGVAQPAEYVFWICPTGGGANGDEAYIGRAQPSVIHNYGAVDIAVRRGEGSYSLEARIPFHTALPGFDPITSARRDRVGFNYLLYRSAAPQVWWAPLATPADAAAQAGILYLERDGS
jgi:hypothetical protein